MRKPILYLLDLMNDEFQPPIIKAPPPPSTPPPYVLHPPIPPPTPFFQRYCLPGSFSRRRKFVPRKPHPRPLTPFHSPLSPSQSKEGKRAVALVKRDDNQAEAGAYSKLLTDVMYEYCLR
ncbi:hypothetical protein GWI33_023127 [Rhynchophorus ferrugineus]|uniref:Uncharacterized protein n=1 Tax=Rhynchophorus ferrugineus TaxID=354439 RepID=A0A834M2K2_RHYFE|nr:hypothetical protein GWI33_023127 [Rhynchophorus ferrugineus]